MNSTQTQAVVPSEDNKYEIKITSESKTYKFDRVFPQNCTQNDVYNECAYPLISKVLEGINCCVFAFGCTGAGKTYSMLGPNGGRIQMGLTNYTNLQGILPKVASELFLQINRLENDAKQLLGNNSSQWQIRLSFLEIYCENVYDLINGPLYGREPSLSCHLREDNGRVYAENAREAKVTSVDQLLGLIEEGSKNRATNSTGVHAHSSRSHAIIVLSVEHRWKIGVKTAEIKSQTSRFTLVDLAGAESMDRSHGGMKENAGVATNLGLLVLSRVLNALASQNQTGKSNSSEINRIPYRDSTLTRIMQSSLAGNAITTMLVCVSPNPLELPMTNQALLFAQNARNVSFKPIQNIISNEFDADPMIGDEYDADMFNMRRTMTIECAFGEVFARCTGSSAAPLVLYVHGSGGNNSSMVWNECAIDMNHMAKGTSDGYYHVAIDCPGYGRSNGDRQTIRSYPGAFLKSVIHALGRRSALCLVGSSQGAAAVLNCTLEFPEMVHAVAVCHPVGHSVERYSQIYQPTLLVFDVDDPGHPVAVGRLMRKHLQNPVYFEYSSSTDGSWEKKHMAHEMHSMLNAVWPKVKSKRNGGCKVFQMQELIRAAGGVKSWSERYNNEVLPWYATEYAIDQGLKGQETIDLQNSEVKDENYTYRMLVDEFNTIIYEHIQSGRKTKIRPKNATVRIELKQTHSDTPKSMNTSKNSLLFSDTEDSEMSEDEKIEIKSKEYNKQRAKECNQSKCDCCGKILIYYVRLVYCRCAVCACCVQRSLKYTRTCPCCGMGVKTFKGNVVNDTHSDELEFKTQTTLSKDDKIEYDSQSKYLYAMQKFSADKIHIVFEYGNLYLTGSKSNYITFCNQINVQETNSNSIHKIEISKVEFNINPGYKKPTSSINSKNHKSYGYTFEYAMGRTYPCVIKVYFKNHILPALLINYSVVETNKVNKRRIVIEIEKSSILNKYSSKDEIRFEADPITNGWIYLTHKDHVTYYLPENNRNLIVEDYEKELKGFYSKSIPNVDLDSKFNPVMPVINEIF